MTISEQIREAALYLRSPYFHMHDSIFDELCVFTLVNEWIDYLNPSDLRTFMLLVAEALE